METSISTKLINQVVYKYLLANFPNAANLFQEESHLSTSRSEYQNPELTLEDVFEVYYQTQSNGGKSETSTYSEEAGVSEHVLPILPSLVIGTVLRFVPCNDLHTLRLVSKEWNYLASGEMTQRRIPVVFDNGNSIQKFCATLNTRIQQNPPISAFEFNFTNQGLSSTLLPTWSRFENIAVDLVQSYTFRMDEHSFYQGRLKTLLQIATNLRSLTFITDDPSKDFLGEVLCLPKLQSFAILPKADRHSTLQLKPPTILQWLQKCPKLTKFESGFLISINTSTTLPEFLQEDTRNLRFLSLHVGILLKAEVSGNLQRLIECRASIQQLKVSSNGHVLNNYSLLSQWVNTLSQTLTKLCITRDFDLTGIELPNCETLEIDCKLIGVGGGRYHWEPISPLHFPALKKIKIVRYPAESFQIFGGGEFMGVENLCIEKSPEFKLENRFFFSYFPNLKSLSMQNACGPLNLAEIIRNYANLVHLQLINFVEGNPADTKDFSEVLTGGILDKNMIWDSKQNLRVKAMNRSEPTLGRLNQLKTLEVGGANMDSVVFGIICLTALDEMPRLDTLTISYEYSDQEKIARMGAMSLGRFDFHRRICVRQIPQHFRESCYRRQWLEST